MIGINTNCNLYNIGSALKSTYIIWEVCSNYFILAATIINYLCKEGGSEMRQALRWIHRLF